MPTVVNTETSAARNSTISISRSRTMRARRRARRSPWRALPISVFGRGTADMKGKPPRILYKRSEKPLRMQKQKTRPGSVPRAGLSA